MDAPGSLCHQRYPNPIRVMLFRIIAKRQGRVDQSHHGNGNFGFHVGPVSAEIRIPSMNPMAGPRGQPQPIINALSPAASRKVCNAKHIVSALVFFKRDT